MELPFLHNQAPLLLRWRMFEIQWLKPEAEQRMRQMCCTEQALCQRTARNRAPQRAQSQQISSGGRKSKVKVLIVLVSSEASLLDWMDVFSLCPHMPSRARETPLLASASFLRMLAAGSGISEISQSVSSWSPETLCGCSLLLGAIRGLLWFSLLTAELLKDKPRYTLVMISIIYF